MSKTYFFNLFVALFLVYGCSDGGGSDSQLDLLDSNRDMSGVWEGSFVTAKEKSYPSKFELVQKAADISGEFEYTNKHGVQKTDEINGTIKDSTVTISVVYLRKNDPDYSFEIVFEGTVEDDTYSGNIDIIFKDKENPEEKKSTGTFSFTAPDTDAEFEISFDWGDIPLCTSGQPNDVNNPRFVLKNVPEGTTSIQFTMTDLDKPDYDHGGGNVQYNGQDAIERDAFSYKSPCPPNGSHRYEWTAVAKKDNGETIGTAKAMKRYPN